MEPRAPASLLEMKGIIKDFPGVRALKGVSFDVHGGEIHALCGENGAGKSTLMKILSGVHPAGSYGGEVLLRGVPVRFRDIADSEKKGIAIIAQELALVPEMSAAENIFLGREKTRRGVIRREAMRREAAALFEKVGLKADPDVPVREMGVGRQQMVEIAKALSKKAEILILDEPTSALTETEAKRLLTLLGELKQSGVVSIIISHKLKEILAVSDRITVLRDGASVGTLTTAGTTESELVRLMVGRPLDDLFHKEKTAAAGREGLRIEKMSLSESLSSGNRLKVREANLFVRQGEIAGLAGLMGAGRSELVSAVFGAFPGEVTGEVFIMGKKQRIASPADAIRNGLALVTEDRKRYGLVLQESVRFNATLACLRKWTRAGVVQRRAEEAAVQKSVSDLSIRTPGMEQRVENLSGGNQQKVVLAKWLMTGPSVLILDEPTRGIDIGAKGELYAIIQSLAQQGKAVLMVSSELPELLHLCDRIYVMHEGRITGCLERGEADQEKIMHLAAGLSEQGRAGRGEGTWAGN